MLQVRLDDSLTSLSSLKVTLTVQSLGTAVISGIVVVSSLA